MLRIVGRARRPRDVSAPVVAPDFATILGAVKASAAGAAATIVFATIAASILAVGAAPSFARAEESPDSYAHPPGLVVFVAPPERGAIDGDGSREHPYRDLYKAVARRMQSGDSTAAAAGLTILLAPGDYWLSPTPVVEPTCGNCAEPNTPVPVTIGLKLTGHRVCLQGAPDLSSIIHTRAGYGLLLQDCRECRLQDLVITDGARDTSGQATDAAVVVQRSTATIQGCRIHDNLGDSTLVRKLVVGVIGIAGREGSRIQIEHNRILHNSWDGIALYRGAQAQILDNTIDGVDLATGQRAGGGRGVGIGVTWDAQATITGNRVTRYWKGIGIFVNARATVEENVVEHIATWGLSIWDAGQGRPHADFRSNVVDSTGACGVMLACPSTDTAPAGSLMENVICRSGQNPQYDGGEPYCFQAAVALHGAAESFTIQGNLLYDNREAGGHSGSGDAQKAVFTAGIRDLCLRLAQRPATRASAFYQRFGPSILSAPESRKDRKR